MLIVGVTAACSGGSGSPATQAPAALDAATLAPAEVDCAPHVDPAPPITTIDAITLVQGEGVDSVLVCRYSGTNTPSNATPGQAGQLQQSGTLTEPAAIAALVAAVNDGPPLLSGKHSCPMADGRSYQVLFQYQTGPVKTIDVEPTGCRSVQDKAKGHAATDTVLALLTAAAGAAV